MEPDVAKTENDEDKQFSRTGTDMFTSRREDVFAALEELEKKHTAFVNVLSRSDEQLVKNDLDEEEEVERNMLVKASPSMSNHRGRSDFEDRMGKISEICRPSNNTTAAKGRRPRSNIQENPDFKRPHQRSFHKRHRPTVPDFKKHPEKYTMYSLRDVSDKDMSEKSNSQAAFAFLKERRLQREKEEREMAGLSEEDIIFDADSAACSQGVIEFSKPCKPENSSNSVNEKATRMPPACSSMPGLWGIDSGCDCLPTNEILESNQTESSSDPQAAPSTSFKARRINNSKRNIRRKHEDDSD
ncbi:protein tssc4 [Plakobranchus ocellatus]|uniref:U5 small nuclear ribonucleoprotein TSSC4 n=1 Tax=Plakobranchus ocellatus TaxID=259542 RepID=A0AAV4CNT2_9GAST|nr:protein tssc4 [Plakobranchus ocellatus]